MRMCTKHLAGCGQAMSAGRDAGPGVDAQIRRAGVGDIAAGRSAPMHWAAHWPSRPPMPPRRSCVSGRRQRESI
ncbi:MAG: hypothetical protein ACLVJH_16170 [Faecalibacterium prausnitzii]